jgi:peptidoglycan/xylan/chitin deacetylase (PgdA/CDA1 family)
MTIKKAYLTIDDAPSSDFRNKVDFLSSHKIPAIFFCIGANIPKYENDMIYAIHKGFIIGNHSWSHPYFSDLSMAECQSEIRRTDEMIESVYQKSGVERPAKFFRFPYFDPGGDVNSAEFNKEMREAPYFRTIYPRDDKRKALQSYLKTLGYRQPGFQGIHLQWFNSAKLPNESDVRCTFDQKEYWLNKEGAPQGLNKAEAILARIDEDYPEGGRALNDSGTTDIILIHDFDFSGQMIELFYKIMNRYIEKGICFLKAV